jgi:hypothetical protein
MPLPVRNPYEILKVPRNASIQAIEDAYDRLFDQYEPRAQAGDRAAIETLNALNDARDALIDPKSRAALDRSLGRDTTKDERRTTKEISQRPPSAPTRPSSSVVRPSSVRARPRSRVVDRRQPRTLASMIPFFIIIAFLVFAFAVAVAYLLNRGQVTPVGDPGAAVATVNGQPIYQADFDAQVAQDKANALNDPMFGALFNNFQGITGTRALDALRSDSLDKLVNMEVIQQQAKKEGVYPTDAQIDTMVTQAKQSDLQNGQTFESFLQQHGITADRYRRAVTENVVYTVMADHHLPQTGSDDDKTQGFINWICTTRKNYDVKVLVTFTVTDNPPCTSGLPSNLPLPGIATSATPPAPEETVAPGLTPSAQTTPQATSKTP